MKRGGACQVSTAILLLALHRRNCAARHVGGDDGSGGDGGVFAQFREDARGAWLCCVGTPVDETKMVMEAMQSVCRSRFEFR